MAEKKQNGGFSSRVLNMKFMRSANDSESVKEENETKKLHDLSEWVLPNLSEKTKLKLASKPKVKKVGYSSILAADEEPLESRFKYAGKQAPEEELESVEKSSKRLNKSEKESKQFLDQLWKQQRKDDDSILDSLSNGISGAGAGTKRENSGKGDGNNDKGVKRRRK